MLTKALRHIINRDKAHHIIHNLILSNEYNDEKLFHKWFAENDG